MLHGVSCIGRMLGGEGDWFAELDFGADEANVYERTREGASLPVATVPLGRVWEEDDDYFAELMDDAQNRRLMMVVFAPELARTVRHVMEEADKVYAELADVLKAGLGDAIKADPTASAETLRDAVWDAMSVLGDIVNECVRAYEALRVPEPDNPAHAEAAASAKGES